MGQVHETWDNLGIGHRVNSLLQPAWHRPLLILFYNKKEAEVLAGNIAPRTVTPGAALSPQPLPYTKKRADRSRLTRANPLHLLSVTLTQDSG